MTKIVSIINREIEDFRKTAAYRALFTYNCYYYVALGSYPAGDLNKKPEIRICRADKEGELIDWREKYVLHPNRLSWAEIDRAIMLSLDSLDEDYYI